MLSPELRDELIRDEGLRLLAYRDTRDFWTIGVGHLLGKGEKPRMTEITRREAEALLAVDVEDAEKLVAEVFGSTIQHLSTASAEYRVRYRALVNMAFNRGGHMKTSTTITPAIKQALLDGSWVKVRKAIEASEWARQVGARATRLADMLVKGTA